MNLQPVWIWSIRRKYSGCCTLLARQGKTIVMVCHDLTMAARYCSRLVMIAGGRILADGRPAEVMTEEHLREGFGSILWYTETACPGIWTSIPMTGKRKRQEARCWFSGTARRPVISSAFSIQRDTGYCQVPFPRTPWRRRLHQISGSRRSGGRTVGNCPFRAAAGGYRMRNDRRRRTMGR